MLESAPAPEPEDLSCLDTLVWLGGWVTSDPGVCPARERGRPEPCVFWQCRGVSGCVRVVGSPGKELSAECI